MWGEQQGRGQTLESEGRHWSHARGWEHGPCGASQWGSSRSSEPQLGCRADPALCTPHSLEGRGQREKGRSTLLPDERAWDHGWLFQSCRDGRFVSGQVPGSLVPSSPLPLQIPAELSGGTWQWEPAPPPRAAVATRVRGHRGTVVVVLGDEGKRRGRAAWDLPHDW